MTVEELNEKFDTTTKLFNYVTRRQSEDIKALNDNIVALNNKINNIVTLDNLDKENICKHINQLKAERQAAKVADFTATQTARAQMPQVTVGSVFDVKATEKLTDAWVKCVNNKNTSEEVSRKLTDNLYSAVREGLEVMTGIQLVRTSNHGFTVVVKWMVPVNIFVRVDTQTKRIFVTFKDRGDNDRESNHWHTTHAVAKVVAVAMFYARSDR